MLCPVNEYGSISFDKDDGAYSDEDGDTELPANKVIKISMYIRKKKGKENKELIKGIVSLNSLMTGNKYASWIHKIDRPSCDKYQENINGLSMLRKLLLYKRYHDDDRDDHLEHFDPARKTWDNFLSFQWEFVRIVWADPATRDRRKVLMTIACEDPGKNPHC